MATASDVLRVAASQVGYSRWSDPQTGTKYGRWYASYTGQAWYGNNGVAYCAMFVSWCFNQAGAKAAGLPGAYTPTMLTAARKAGKALSNKKNAKPGDIVYFDWGGATRAGVDHVGIVEKNCGSYIQTIEGNTSSGTAGSQSNGGVVARRTRAWSTVCGVVRPDYAGAAASAACGGVVPLVVDGHMGKLTVAALQRFLKSKKLYNGIVDGDLSNQSRSEFKRHFPAVNSVTFGNGGSDTVRGVQRLVGAKVDGYAGKETANKLQQWLVRTDKAGISVDGSFGPLSVKALQIFLNKGGWYK